jgi:hypothetical protein
MLALLPRFDGDAARVCGQEILLSFVWRFGPASLALVELTLQRGLQIENVSRLDTDALPRSLYRRLPGGDASRYVLRRELAELAFALNVVACFAGEELAAHLLEVVTPWISCAARIDDLQLLEWKAAAKLLRAIPNQRAFAAGEIACNVYPEWRLNYFAEIVRIAAKAGWRDDERFAAVRAHSIPSVDAYIAQAGEERESNKHWEEGRPGGADDGCGCSQNCSRATRR